MKCPICNEDIPAKKTDVTNNEAKKKADYKEYKRVIYWCEKDDTWIGVETPIEKSF